MKNVKIKGKNQKKMDKSNTLNFCKHKITNFQNMITSTIRAVQKYKIMNIITTSDLNVCIQNLETLYKQLNTLKVKLQNSKKEFDDIISELQKINNELSAVFKATGTRNIVDLISVTMGAEFSKRLEHNDIQHIFEVIRNYVHPIGYKVLSWRENKKQDSKTLTKNRIVEDFMIVERSKNFDCFDLSRTSKDFQKKVYGIKVAIQNASEKKTLIISAIVDDILIECTNHIFIQNKIQHILNNKPTEPEFQSQHFDRYVTTLTIKELLIYSTQELYSRFIGYVNQINLIKQKPISQNVKEFIASELYNQRLTLIQLLLKHNDPEFQYLAYLLYDLLSNDNNGNIDTNEQTVLFDSLPWNIKKYFRDAMKTTINYTNSLSNFDSNKIPIEQQICLMKASDVVKEKAMVKLKEVKAKSEDSGSKARQYLDGLLKIPFGIYRREPVLSIMNTIKTNFSDCIDKIKANKIQMPIHIPDNCRNSSLEITKYFPIIEKDLINELNKTNIKKLISLYTTGKRNDLIVNICYINNVIKKLSLKTTKICHSGKKNEYMRNHIKQFILTFCVKCQCCLDKGEKTKETDGTSVNTENKNDKKESNGNKCVCKHNKHMQLMQALQSKFPQHFNVDLPAQFQKTITDIRNDWTTVGNAIDDVNESLEKSVHGHINAKRQLQRIIGQWINGEQKGYCFGFEGPPGVGKTSLAKKGLAECLKDSDGNERPFAFIPIGGSSNGSTLCGHNYTYVGSTWGRIVDILMEKKCMNPIIFIDELDKVSRSEHGKEIIGILTHLIDSTQNESFQDKYFNGIDLDLSKALFIFSYNSPELIDKILLDRIHRVKFDNLSIEDKQVIARKYLLPEIYKKIGLNDCVVFTDDIIQFIIETYTYEPGVRKLKEILFEILSEINLEILQNTTKQLPIEMTLTKELIKNKYLKDRHEISFAKIHDSPTAGLVTGLWANSLGKGGIIPIECIYYPSSTPLDFKLTGLQGDVMKESMNVSKSLAWKLTSTKNQEKLLKKFARSKLQGIHIHCPEGATPKDGPSAGTAITVAIYSLLNNLKVKNDLALTGEINLQGKVSMIGGLKLKILGGIKAGVKTFLYPKDNHKDFKKFMDKYREKPLIEGISFHAVETIQQVLKLVFV